MDFEPIAPPPIPGAVLAHPHEFAFVQTTCLAGCPRLLVNDALVVVLTLGDRVGVVVRPAEERLKQKNTNKFN